jgi:3-oxoacyl-[acyl-carrier protein] reductase
MAERVALIPGGAKGIGREIARRLGEEGWAVALAYRSSAAEAEETAALVERAGGRALAVRADVSTPEACAELLEATRRWQGGAGARLDALIHCAGPYHRVDILEETPEGWRQMFAANLDSLFYMSRLCAPMMIANRWGRIVAFSMANADKLQAQPGLTAHYLA